MEKTLKKMRIGFLLFFVNYSLGAPAQKNTPKATPAAKKIEDKSPAIDNKKKSDDVGAIQTQDKKHEDSNRKAYNRNSPFNSHTNIDKLIIFLIDALRNINSTELDIVTTENQYAVDFKIVTKQDLAVTLNIDKELQSNISYNDQSSAGDQHQDNLNKGPNAKKNKTPMEFSFKIKKFSESVAVDFEVIKSLIYLTIDNMKYYPTFISYPKSTVFFTKGLLTLLEELLPDTKTFVNYNILENIHQNMDKLKFLLNSFQYILFGVIHNIVLKHLLLDLTNKKIDDIAPVKREHYFESLQAQNKLMIKIISKHYMNDPKINRLINKITTKLPVLAIKLDGPMRKDEKITEINKLLKYNTKITKETQNDDFIKYLDSEIQKDPKNIKLQQELNLTNECGSLVLAKKYLETKDKKTQNNFIKSKYINKDLMKQIVIDSKKNDQVFYTFYSNIDLTTGKPGNFIYIINTKSNNIIYNNIKNSIMNSGNISFVFHDSLNNLYSKTDSEYMMDSHGKLLLIQCIILNMINGYVDSIKNPKDLMESGISKIFDFSVCIRNIKTKEVSDSLNQESLLKDLQTKPFVMKLLKTLTTTMGGAEGNPGLNNNPQNEMGSADGNFDDESFNEELF